MKGSELAGNLLEFRCEAFKLALKGGMVDGKRAEIGTLVFIGFREEVILLLQVNKVNLQRCYVRRGAG